MTSPLSPRDEAQRERDEAVAERVLEAVKAAQDAGDISLAILLHAWCGSSRRVALTGHCMAVSSLLENPDLRAAKYVSLPVMALKLDTFFHTGDVAALRAEVLANAERIVESAIQMRRETMPATPDAPTTDATPEGGR